MSLKYENFRFDWAVVTENPLKSAYSKVSYLCTLHFQSDKSSFSPGTDIFEK